MNANAWSYKFHSAIKFFRRHFFDKLNIFFILLAFTAGYFLALITSNTSGSVGSGAPAGLQEPQSLSLTQGSSCKMDLALCQVDNYCHYDPKDPEYQPCQWRACATVAASKGWGYETPIVDVFSYAQNSLLMKDVLFSLIDYRPHYQANLFNALLPFVKEFNPPLHPNGLDDTRYYIKGGGPGIPLNTMFGLGDASILYSFIRLHRPKRIIEIGSGFSTRVVQEALIMNLHDHQSNTDTQTSDYLHTCIEPYRSFLLNVLTKKSKIISVISKTLEDFLADPSYGVQYFQNNLNDGDLLMIDSSHIWRLYGDGMLEYMLILPKLKPGVFVFIHDIAAPFDYGSEWIVKQQRQYTEQYILALLMYGNPSWSWELSLANIRDGLGNVALGKVAQFIREDQQRGRNWDGAAAYIKRN